MADLIEPVPKKDRTLGHIIFERIPAFFFVGALLLLLLGGLIFPELTAYFVIILNVYFLYKSGMLALTFFLSVSNVNRGESIDWRTKLEGLTNREAAEQEIHSEIKTISELKFSRDEFINIHRQGFTAKFVTRFPAFIQSYIFRREKQKAIMLLEKQLVEFRTVKARLDWRELQHIVIVPHVKEPEHILRETLEHLQQQNFPTEQINVVLAAEERDPGGLPMSEKLAAEFKDMFNNIWISNHVLDEEIEAVGKSSNMKAGGKLVYEKVKELGWDLKKTLVTSCDADSKLPDQYFSYVSYEYATRKNAEFKYYTGAMVFYNNIWKLPFYARVKNSMSTIYNVARLVRTDKLIPFSTYTTSLWIVKEIGFWTPWVTPEDFHLFFKAQLKFGAKVNAVPIYLKIMSDAAEGQNHGDTFKNNYQQERRWAWGISDDGWILHNLLGNFGQHDFVTYYRGFHAVFDHVMSPVLGVLLVVGGNIPPLINPVFSSTVLGARLPQVSSSIIIISLVFMISLIVIDAGFKPNRPGKPNPLRTLLTLAEWLVLPIASFMLAVLPGLESNTRLLFGKHLEYYVTKKH